MSQQEEFVICARCQNAVTKLYPMWFRDDETGEEKTYMICWDCDWDITNGRGELHDDPGEIYADRREEAYAYDPINNPRPY